MNTIISQSELLRRALAFVNDERKDSPNKKIGEILDEAAMRFNLSPLDTEGLSRLLSTETDTTIPGV